MEYKNGDEKIFLNLEGDIVERNPIDFPYSFDRYLIWKSKKYRRNKSYNISYSDRLKNNDTKRFTEAKMQIFENSSYTFPEDPEKIEKFLSIYFKRKIELIAVEVECNRSNGYPYWIFYYL